MRSDASFHDSSPFACAASASLIAPSVAAAFASVALSSVALGAAAAAELAGSINVESALGVFSESDLADSGAVTFEAEAVEFETVELSAGAAAAFALSADLSLLFP